jgi:hypothetical protein
MESGSGRQSCEGDQRERAVRDHAAEYLPVVEESQSGPPDAPLV